MNKIDPSCHEKLELMKAKLAADQKFEGLGWWSQSHLLNTVIVRAILLIQIVKKCQYYLDFFEPKKRQY